MKEPISERRLAENEVVFRRANEKIEQGLKQAQAEEVADKVAYPGTLTLKLHFYCECADDKCNQRIVLTVSQFKKLHKTSAQFVILPGHEIPEIEKIVKKTSRYYVVEKYMKPPKVATLHQASKNLTQLKS